MQLRIQENPSSAGAQELRPGPRWGSLQRCRQPASWWEGAGCPLPKNPIPRSQPFGSRLFYPHSKISSDAVVPTDSVKAMKGNSVSGQRQVGDPRMSLGWAYPGNVICSFCYLTVLDTRQYCIKTAKLTLKLFRPSCSPIILVSSNSCADTQFQGEPLQQGH